MTGVINLIRRTSLITVALVMLSLWILIDLFIFMSNAGAAQIVSRKITISSSANGDVAVGAAGTGGNGAQASHTFEFTEGTTGATVGSVELLYCTSPLPGTTCTAPTGLDASTATSVTGTTSAQWTMDTSTANRLRLTRTGGPATITDTQVLKFGNGNTGTDWIKNPTTDNEEFFVRITTFSDAAYTTAVDQGTVANSTAQQIEITAKVQETLNFSVGAPDVGSVPAATPTSCTPFSDDGAMTLGDATDGVLSFLQSYDAYSFFRLSTNANNGAIVYYSGDTLKNVSDPSEDIAAIGGTAAQSDVGAEQFGLAFDTSQGSHSFTDITTLEAAYDGGAGTITEAGTAEFAFDTGSITTPVQIASAAATVTCDTGAIRYIGNISTTTPPGVYTTTLTYIATPTY